MLAGETIPQLLQERIKKTGASAAMKHKQGGAWREITWNDVGAAVREINQGLRASGFGKGDRVSLLSNTRPEWIMIDQAVLALGGVSVPIYPSNLADQCRYILDNSQSVGLFVESREQLAKYQQVRDQVPDVRLVVIIDGEAPVGDEKIVSLETLRERGRKFDGDNAGKFEAGIAEVRKEDLATLVYTSGTTGNPKGVMLDHNAFVKDIRAVANVLSAGEDDTTLSFLPLAHIFARVESIGNIYLGWTAAFAESLDKIVENLGEVRPTLMFSVPRIYERAYQKILGGIEEGSPLKRALFNWAVGVGGQVSQVRQKGREPAGWLGIKFKIADALIFSKVREKLGMTRLRFAISGGAPLSKKIGEFFHALGVLILEGYGLTETTAAATVNLFERYKFGTVGKAIPGVEVKIAGDGEILLRGETVFKGYYRNEEATQEALAADGWFHTGDIGELDADGFLRITDRKKDLIVTAGGKNIAPQNIENLLKTDRHISQVMVFGDKRKYLTALITLNMEEMDKWCVQHGMGKCEPETLCKDPKVIEFFQGIVNEKNEQLASYESIKKFALIPGDFTVESGELTPTLKVKRKFVTTKHKAVLDSMYDKKDIIE